METIVVLATATLTSVDWAGMGAIMSLPFALVSFYLKAIRHDNAAFRVRLDKKIEQIESRVLTIERDKVDKGDWVRVVMSQKNRQDKTMELIAELSGKLDATIGISRQAQRIADVLEQRQEVT